MAAQGEIVSNSSSEGRRVTPSEHPLPIARGIAGDLRKWPLYHSLRSGFAKTVRLCYVFGAEGTELLLITENDEVWGRGFNSYGLLGTGNETAVPHLRKIPELCGKSIETFAIGVFHALAVTNKGEVYGWGKNEHFNVGPAGSRGILAPTFVYNGEDPALEIACGGCHSVCRTRKGAVYSWGKADYLGIGSQTMQPIAIQKVEKVIGRLKCAGISCCRYSTVAVFENGEVYTWGWYNGNGELGIGSTVHERIPVRVELGNTAIRKVACGSNHTLALSVDGSLYVWGSNYGGELGLGHTNSQLRPSCHSNLKETFGPILEIAAAGIVSAVMTENSKVLMWGPGGDDSPMVPTEVPCESIQDVFAAWTELSVTPVPLIVISDGDWTTNSTAQKSDSASGWDGNLANTVAEQFNNPRHADVKFLVGSETIHAHRMVLKFQSEYFTSMFEGAWKDSGDTLKVDKYSHSVYKAFLRYFYTGELNLPAVETVELLELAKECSENALKIKCQERLKNMLAVENCASIYESAVQFNSKEVEDLSCRFAVNNLAAVIQATGSAALPDNVVGRFFNEVAKRGAFKK